MYCCYLYSVVCIVYLGDAAEVLCVLVHELPLLPVHALERLDPTLLLRLENIKRFAIGDAGRRFLKSLETLKIINQVNFNVSVINYKVKHKSPKLDIFI